MPYAKLIRLLHDAFGSDGWKHEVVDVSSLHVSVQRLIIHYNRTSVFFRKPKTTTERMKRAIQYAHLSRSTVLAPSR